MTAGPHATTARPHIVVVRSLLTAYGGAEHTAALTARALKRRAYDVTVVTRPPVARSHPYYTLLEEAGVPVLAPPVIRNAPALQMAARLVRPTMFPPYYVLRRKTTSASWQSVCAITDHWLVQLEHWWLLRAINRVRRRGQPTIVHVFGQEGWTPLLTRWTAERGIPLLYTETGAGDDAYVATHDLKWTIEVINQIPLVICPGPRVARHIRFVYGYKGPIAEIPFFIEEPGRAPVPKAAESGREEVVIGAVGRLVEVKGHADVIWAVARLREHGLPVRAVIAGDGPLHGALQAQAAQFGVADAVRFTGRFVSLEDVLDDIDVFVQSSASEGQPLTLTEAMAFGKPAVAYDCGDIAELVLHGTTGFLVTPGNKVELVSRLAELVTNPALRLTMAGAARRLYLETRSTDAVVRRMEAAYASVLDVRRSEASYGVLTAHQ